MKLCKILELENLVTLYLLRNNTPNKGGLVSVFTPTHQQKDQHLTLIGTASYLTVKVLLLH